jgi:RNA polymerase sigma factor (TIGR02999 family)
MASRLVAGTDPTVNWCSGGVSVQFAHPFLGGSLLGHARSKDRNQDVRVGGVVDSGEFTRVLRLASNGNGEAVDRLFVALYDELRAMARNKFKNERPDQTLQATALVHEAYVRLVDQRGAQWKNKAHFFAVAARVMRQILVDHARRRHAKKRLGGKRRVALEEALTVSMNDSSADLVALDAALTRLQEEQPEKA